MKIIASSVYRIENCPFSLELEESFLDSTFRNDFKTFAASFGSDMHDIAEKQIKAYLAKEKISTIKSMIINSGIEKDTVDFDKGFKAIDTYVKYIKKLIVRFKRKPGFKVQVEDKYRVKYGRYEMVAKMDFMCSYIEKDIVNIHIADLKTGTWDYSKSAYSQMLFTTLLVIFQDFKEYENFNINIYTVQPNYYFEDMKIVLSGKVFLNKTPKDLIESFLFTIHENPTCKPGSYCKFCPCLLICPEMIKNIISLELWEETMKLTFEQLEKIHLQSEHIKTYLKTVEEFLIVNEDKLKLLSVKHNKKSKKLIKIENPFTEV